MSQCKVRLSIGVTACLSSERPSSGRMERSGGGEESGASQQANSTRRQFQTKTSKLSPKLSSREPEDRKERGMWMFKKMKRKENVVLDRVISSSQPDLLFSSQEAEAAEDAAEAAKLCGKGATGSGHREKLKSSSPKKPTVAHLVQSHHKSSSLGSACLERLAEPPRRSSGSSGGGGGEAATAAAAAERQLESRDEQQVSYYLSRVLEVEVVVWPFNITVLTDM